MEVGASRFMAASLCDICKQLNIKEQTRTCSLDILAEKAFVQNMAHSMENIGMLLGTLP